MIKNSKEIQATNSLLDLSGTEKIAEGNDSHVFRIGDSVYKEYQHISFEQASRYVKLMNQVVPVIEEIGYRFKLKINETEFSIDFAGLSVDRITTDTKHLPVSVSRYLPEPNLDKLFQSPDLFSKYPLNRIKEASHRKFFMDLNSFFFKENPTRVRDEFEYHVCILSRLLDAHFGAFGIYIGKYNVKLFPSLDKNKITLFVTDLSVYMNRLFCEGSPDVSRALYLNSIKAL